MIYPAERIDTRQQAVRMIAGLGSGPLYFYQTPGAGGEHHLYRNTEGQVCCHAEGDETTGLSDALAAELLFRQRDDWNASARKLTARPTKLQD